jgi:hypothetical protein
LLNTAYIDTRYPVNWPVDYTEKSNCDEEQYRTDGKYHKGGVGFLINNKPGCKKSFNIFVLKL